MVLVDRREDSKMSETLNPPTPEQLEEQANPPQEQLPANEREVHDIKTGSIIALDRSRSKADLKAIMVDILDRGVTASRLDLDVQPDIHYEWVPNNALDKSRMKTFGFEVLSRSRHLLSGNPLHEGGGDEIIVGDVIAMGCSKVRKQALDEVKSERFIAMHGRPGSKVQAEETNFAAQMQADLEKSGIGTIVESDTKKIGTADIVNSLKTT